jgi:hypothetical protein
MLQQGNQPYEGSFSLGMPYGVDLASQMSQQMVPMNRAMGLPGEEALNNLSRFRSPGVNTAPLMGALQTLLGNPTPNLDLSGINNMANQGFSAATNFGQNAVTGANQFGQNAWSAAQGFGNQASGAYGAAMPTAMNLAQTGGAPMQALLHALDAIHQSGQIDIGNNLAAIRERYGKQGLGAGSDVNTALGLGATQGQAQLEAQQSSLLSQVLQNAAQVQLGGVNALQGIGAGYGNIGSMLGSTALGAGNLISNTGLGAGNLASGAAGMAGGLMTSAQGLNLNAQSTGLQAMLGALGPGLNIMQQPQQSAMQQGQMQLGAASALPAYLNSQLSAYQGATGNLLNMAGMNQQANMYTNQAQYQDFQRMQQLPPGVQAALGFATSYPNMGGQASGGFPYGAAIGAGGSIIGAMIAAGMLSDRNAKENIVPVTSALDRLRKLPIYKWNYKWDKTPHIGPMAQDWQSTFGVGDGVTIHPIDVVGVVLQSMKELGERVH